MSVRLVTVILISNISKHTNTNIFPQINTNICVDLDKPQRQRCPSGWSPLLRHPRAVNGNITMMIRMMMMVRLVTVSVIETPACYCWEHHHHDSLDLIVYDIMIRYHDILMQHHDIL